MRVLLVHNFYQQPGGEDQAYASEFDLLSSRGIYVRRYSVHNDSITGVSGIHITAKTIWNRETYRSVRQIIKDEAIGLVHCHNTFPLVSPAIYYAAEAERVPVVQTLHNYRLLCPAATLFRDGAVCELCLHSRLKYKAVIHRCYRGSASASAVVTGMLAAHDVLGTWKSKIHTYIALTQFAKDKFIEGGLPASKITVKPNFLPQDPGLGNGEGRYAAFVGRLSQEKGLDTLLEAWQFLGPGFSLKIAGDGPLGDALREKSKSSGNIEVLGRCDRSLVIELLRNAAMLVFPSECYEGLPMTIIEAFACGTPVIASARGSMNELVVDGVNGFRFAPKDAAGLSSRVREVLGCEVLAGQMRRQARASYEQHYTADRNYSMIMPIYHKALQSTLPLS